MTSPIPTSFPLEDLIVANLYRLLMVDDQGQAVPLSANMLTGGGGASVSASEATQQQILSAIQALAPLLGNTDGLEVLAAANRDLLTNLGTYTDGLENLLTLLNTNTDGIESLLSALGVNDQNVIGKLEALRVLSESTNTHMQAANGNSYILAQQAQGEGLRVSLPDYATNAELARLRATLNSGAVSFSRSPTGALTDVLNIPANASMSGSVALGGRSVVRVMIGGSWTAADLTVQTSPDGQTWFDLYDEYGSAYIIKAAAARSIYIAPGPLLAVSYLRLRSGTPAAPVNQAAQATVTLVSVAL